MAEKGSAGQADKAATEAKTASVADENAQLSTSERTGAQANNPEGSVPNVPGTGDDVSNPYPNYDFMTLEALQSLADERGVEVNRDVLKAHLITELRAADSGTPSAATRHGAR